HLGVNLLHARNQAKSSGVSSKPTSQDINNLKTIINGLNNNYLATTALLYFIRKEFGMINKVIVAEDRVS
ncbi:hypothetical protein PJP10_32225, partial [Mycobacterium kansasii]